MTTSRFQKPEGSVHTAPPDGSVLTAPSADPPGFLREGMIARARRLPSAAIVGHWPDRCTSHGKGSGVASRRSYRSASTVTT